MRLLKSAEATSPRVNLVEMGPSFDLKLRRTSYADEATMKLAMKRPKALPSAPKKVKNISRSKLLGKQGRLHMPKQDLAKMATAKMKGLKKGRAENGDGEGARPAKRAKA